MMDTGIFRRVNFDFYVYLVYHKRETDIRYVHTFKVTAPGHVIAQETARDNCAEFIDGIQRNKFHCYFACSKRVSAISSDFERGRCESMGEVEITRQQAEYFASHRQMNP